MENLIGCLNDLGGCCRYIGQDRDYDSDDDFVDDPRMTQMSYKPDDAAIIAKQRVSEQNRTTRTSTNRRHTGLKKNNRISDFEMVSNQLQQRQSVAVVECPLPSLLGKGSEERMRESTFDGRESSTSFSQGGGPRMSCVLANPPVRPSIAIPISRNVSVSALEVCPASPEREKLIEVYFCSTHTVTKAESIQHLSCYFQNVERDALVVLANEEDDDFTETDMLKFKHAIPFTAGLGKEVERLNRNISILGFDDGKGYLEKAVSRVKQIQKQSDGKNITIGVSRCSEKHNKSLIEDINGIHILVSDKNCEKATITKPRGVPVIYLDTTHVAHISIGFDEYGQYEVRKTELVDYYSFLEETGISDFIEEEEVDIQGKANQKMA